MMICQHLFHTLMLHPMALRPLMAQRAIDLLIVNHGRYDGWAAPGRGGRTRLTRSCSGLHWPIRCARRTLMHSYATKTTSASPFSNKENRVLRSVSTSLILPKPPVPTRARQPSKQHRNPHPDSRRLFHSGRRHHHNSIIINSVSETERRRADSRLATSLHKGRVQMQASRCESNCRSCMARSAKTSICASATLQQTEFKGARNFSEEQISKPSNTMFSSDEHSHLQLRYRIYN